MLVCKNKKKKLKNYFSKLNALINNEFKSQMSHVNGAWVKIRRKGCQLSLWTKSADEAFIQFVIGFVLYSYKIFSIFSIIFIIIRQKFKELLDHPLISYEVNKLRNYNLNIYIFYLIQLNKGTC